MLHRLPHLYSECFCRSFVHEAAKQTDALRAALYRCGAASRLTARVNPVSCPACRVLQRLLFAREVIERIELVTAFGARAFGAFEQKIGREPTIGQTMR